MVKGSVGEVDVNVLFKEDKSSIDLIFESIASEAKTAAPAMDPLVGRYQELLTELEKTRDYKDVWQSLGHDVQEFDDKIAQVKDELAATFEQDYKVIIDVDKNIASKVAKELNVVPQEAQKAGVKAKGFLNGAFKDFDISNVSNQFKSLNPVLGQLTTAAKAANTATTALGSSSGFLASGLGAATLGVGAVALAIVGLGYAFRGASNEVKIARQEFLTFFDGNEYAVDALLDAMAGLESITYRNKLELSETNILLQKLDNGVNSIDQAAEYMKRLEIATGGSNAKMKQVPELFKSIESSGKLTERSLTKLTDLFGTKVVEAARKFESQGVSSGEAVKKAIEDSTGSVEDLDDKLKGIFSNPERNADRLKVALGNLAEHIGDLFSPLANWLDGIFASSIEWANSFISELRRMTDFVKDKLAGLDPYEEAEKRLRATEVERIANIEHLKEDSLGAIEYMNKLLGELENVATLGEKNASAAGFRSVTELKESIEYVNDRLAGIVVNNLSGLKNMYPEVYKEIFSAIDKGNAALKEKTATAVKEATAKGAKEGLEKGVDNAQIEKKLMSDIGNAARLGLAASGDMFKAIAQSGVQGAIQGSLNLSQSVVGQVGSFLEDAFKSAPIVGGVLGGITSLWTGIVELFGDVSEKRKRELEETLNRELDAINLAFEREKEIREKAISKLEDSLDAYQKAVDAGQLSAEEYYNVRGDISGKIEAEQMMLAKSQKISEFAREEVQKKKEYDEENSKWFPDRGKLSELSAAIDRLKQRQRRVQQAATIAEINAAKDGTLQRVDSPTLFLAGEAGSEIVKIKPLKAGIDPALEDKARKGGNTYNLILNNSGMIGDTTELSKTLYQILMDGLDQLGEKAVMDLRK